MSRAKIDSNNVKVSVIDVNYVYVMTINKIPIYYGSTNSTPRGRFLKSQLFKRPGMKEKVDFLWKLINKKSRGRNKVRPEVKVDIVKVFDKNNHKTNAAQMMEKRLISTSKYLLLNEQYSRVKWWTVKIEELYSKSELDKIKTNNIDVYDVFLQELPRDIRTNYL